jgi:glycosyltransferase involved in cell wall biosynthesis
MKKIGLFLSAGPEDGGMFQYSQAMLSALGDLPADEYSLVVAYADPTWKERIPGRKAAGVAVRWGKIAPALAVVPAFLPVSYLRWGLTLARFTPWVDDLKQQGCALWVFPRQDVWSAMLPLPMLGAVHDLMHRYEPHFTETSSYGRSRYRDAYLRSLCRNARGILVDSEMGRRHVEESYGTPAGRLFVLPYIPPAYLSQADENPDFQNTNVENADLENTDFEKRYQLPPKYVFYPAQFWEHKNHVRLIRAIAEVRRDLPDVCLVLVGSRNNGYAAAHCEVKRLGIERHIRFAGYVPECDMAEFYRRARALVLPTLFGPTNIPPLEGFALGCPVAASGIYGMPEQIGDAGLLFDPHSVESMVSKIRQLWVDDDLCEKLRARGKARAAAWGPDQFARALHGIIQQLTC